MIIKAKIPYCCLQIWFVVMIGHILHIYPYIQTDNNKYSSSSRIRSCMVEANVANEPNNICVVVKSNKHVVGTFMVYDHNGV